MRQILFAALALTLSACANQTPGDASSGVAASNQAFEAAFNAGDSAALAALYTKDTAVLPPNLARIDGRDGAQNLWQNFFDAGITDIDLVTDELLTNDGWATEIGHFTLKAPDGNGGTATLKGKFVVLWKLEGDGVWRLHRDIWNTDPN